MNKNAPKNTLPTPASAPYWRHFLGGAAPSSSTTSPPNKDSTSNAQSNASVDTATTTLSSTAASTSTEEDKYTVAGDTEHLVDTLVMVRTQNNKAAFALRPRKRERGHLAIAMEIMDEIEAEIDESEIISNDMDAEDTMAPDLFEQSLTKLLKPRKKERHYFFMAEDILRDLGEEDGEW